MKAPGTDQSVDDQNQTLDIDFRENEQSADSPLLLQPTCSKSSIMNKDELRSFRMSLKWWALDHSSCTGRFISYTVFAFLTVLVPMATSLSLKNFSFNKVVQLPESGLTTIAFFTLAGFFHKYSLGQLLFLEELKLDSWYVQRGYARELEKAFRYLACILLPSFFLQVAHKIMVFSTAEVAVLPLGPRNISLNSMMFVAALTSWVYRTGVFLLVSVLFRLTCELQILRLEGFQNLLEESGCVRGSDAAFIFREHKRIRKQLSCTSHRYRLFIIASLVTITVSQLGALLLVLASKSEKTFFNSGDLLICSAVQLSGFFLCLLAAARITHRAQGIVSVASRWHMHMTCAQSTESDEGKWKPTTGGTTATHDFDSSQALTSAPSSPQSSSFQTRQALVAYLQHNNGGITLYGFALDRGLLHTLFAFEFSLVLWILSKVVVLS